MQFKFQLLFIFKNLIFKKDDLIKNDDVKLDWPTIKCTIL